MGNIILTGKEGFEQDARKQCRVCGCTEDRACQDPHTPEGACRWVEPDLCSACDAPVLDPQDRTLAPESVGALMREVQLVVDAQVLMCVISTIQLAMRHPDFQGPTRDVVEHFARDVVKIISGTPQLSRILRAGFNVKYDEPRSEFNRKQFRKRFGGNRG